MDSKTLEARQRWTLSQKIDHTLGTIDTFVSRLGGLDKVYCSFSGGKDSTVLLHLCRVLFPDILAVFCNTGNVRAKYGRLTADYRNDIAQGLSECWRVLQPFGILVFKWNEEQIKVAPILKRFGREPLFGHITGRSGKTRWYCFMKTDE